MSKTDRDSLLEFFEYKHLTSVKMQHASKQFHDLAHWIADHLPRNAERTVALRKLLEAKDAGVRAALMGVQEEKKEQEEKNETVKPLEDWQLWKGDGPAPAYWSAKDPKTGLITKVYRSYEDFVDD